jgi:3-hydroxyacyl-[acyl-carrier-protein] dehydratase
MLLKDFYELRSLDSTGDKTYSAIIDVNAAHEVFKGHFPGNPVMPGVCMMQIVKEITQRAVDKPLTLESAVNVKFMAVINPEATPQLKLDLEITETVDGQIKVKNTTYFNDTVALKLSCVYIIKP